MLLVLEGDALNARKIPCGKGKRGDKMLFLIRFLLGKLVEHDLRGERPLCVLRKKEEPLRPPGEGNQSSRKE